MYLYFTDLSRQLKPSLLNCSHIHHLDKQLLRLSDMFNMKKLAYTHIEAPKYKSESYEYKLYPLICILKPNSLNRSYRYL